LLGNKNLDRLHHIDPLCLLCSKHHVLNTRVTNNNTVEDTTVFFGKKTFAYNLQARIVDSCQRTVCKLPRLKQEIYVGLNFLTAQMISGFSQALSIWRSKLSYEVIRIVSAVRRGNFFGFTTLQIPLRNICDDPLNVGSFYVLK
jgi:hypothetical protein